jgi:hypothetical protein
MNILKRGRPVASLKAVSTTITLNADELTILGRLISAGQVMVPTKHPVLGRIKAAMSRLGVPAPKGL